jgi:hypothetical protein
MLRVFRSIFLLAALPLAAAAQTRHEAQNHSGPAKGTERPLPAVAPKASVSTGQAGASAFARYQRFTPDEPLKNWREVNDTVRAIGGWQVYGREAARAIEAERKESEKPKGDKPWRRAPLFLPFRWYSQAAPTPAPTARAVSPRTSPAKSTVRR